MKIGRMNVSVFCAMGVFFLAAGAARASVASPQSVTTVESGSVGFYLSGTGTNWTLVTAPQHGGLTIMREEFSPGGGFIGRHNRKVFPAIRKNFFMAEYFAWRQGETATYSHDGENVRGSQGVGYVFYCPTPGYVGPDAFVWHSHDARGTSTDVVCSITVTPNHAPVANPQAVTCVQNSTNKYIGLNYTHADGGAIDKFHRGQTLTFTLVSGPTHGTLKYYNGGKDGSTQGVYLAVTAGTPIRYYGWSYTPDAAYTGADGFTWKCNDTFVDSGTATVTIAVAPKTCENAAVKPVFASKDGTYFGPGDIVPDAMTWYGVRGYSRAVAATGTQKAVQINRYSDGASMDVLIKPNGDLDSAAAATFCAGTIARVELWYDQSGHGNDMWGTLWPPDGCPLLTTMASCTQKIKCDHLLATLHYELEHPLLTFDANAKPATWGHLYPAFVAGSLPCVELHDDDRMFANRNFVGAAPAGTFSTVGMRHDGGFGGQLMVMNTLNNRALGIWLFFDTPAANQAALDVSNGNNIETRITTVVDETDAAAFHAFQAVINGASSVLNVDGVPTCGSLQDANLANSLYFGGNYGGGGLIGRMTEAGVWPTVFSPDEQTAMYQNQRLYWHLPAVASVRRGEVAVSNTHEAPLIDGTISRFWSGWMRPTSLLLGKIESTEIGALQTTAHILMDTQNLYVAWLCQERNTDALVANTTNRDGDVRSDDSVEMFLSPDGKTYYHFVVNSRGVFADGKGALNQKEDLTWNSSAVIKTSVDTGRTWTVTMSLPLSELGVTSGKDQAWLLNLNRTKPVKDQAGATTFIQSSWSSSGHGNYADASGWGKLTGVNIP